MTDSDVRLYRRLMGICLGVMFAMEGSILGSAWPAGRWLDVVCAGILVVLSLVLWWALVIKAYR